MKKFFLTAAISVAMMSTIALTGCDDVLAQLKDKLKQGQQEKLEFSLVLENTEPEVRYSAVIYGTDGKPVAGADGKNLSGGGVSFAFLVLPGEYQLKVTGKTGTVKTTKTDSVVFVDGLFKVVTGWDDLLEADVAEEATDEEGEAVTDDEPVAYGSNGEEAVADDSEEAVEDTETEEKAVAEEPGAVEKTEDSEAVEESDTEEEAVADEPEEPDYRLELDVSGTYAFPDAVIGYGVQSPQTITITNIGNQPTGNLTLNVSNTDFSLHKAIIANIAVYGTATFTVTPTTGLTTGVHTATVTVSGGNGISASFDVSFAVAPTKVNNFPDLLMKMAVAATYSETSYIFPRNTGGDSYTTALSLIKGKNCPAIVTIDGDEGGWLVSGSGNSITVGADITLTLKNITFAKIPFIVAAGGTLVLDTGAVIQSTAEATGITVNGGTLEMKDGSLVTDNHASGVRLTNGVFTMKGGSITNNSSPNYGGGVAIIDGGTFTMTGGSISDNKAGHGGGGVYMEGDGGTFIMTGGSISANGMDSGGYGGGVYAEGDGVSFTLDGGVITGNKASYGAGVMISGEGATFTMDSGTISYNQASNRQREDGSVYSAGQGGGVRLGGGVSFTLNGGEISNNTSEGYGGGIILMALDIVFKMTGGVIKGNTAGLEGGGVDGYTDTFNMTGGEITGNSAANGGGGVYLDEGTLEGNPSIGSKDSSRGSIYGNDPDDIYPPVN